MFQGQKKFEVEMLKIWEKYYPRVYGYFFRRIDNQQDIEDLTSLCLTILLEQSQQKVIKNIDLYLWKIVFNQLQEYFRSKSKIPVSLEIIENISQKELEIWEKKQQENQKNDQHQKLIELIINTAKKFLKPQELDLFFSYYQESNVFLEQKYNLKPATLRQRIKRIKTKLKKNLDLKNLF